MRRSLDELRRQIVDMYQNLRSKDHFEVLGIGREAGAAEVKDAYFRLARPFHPDAHRDLPLEDLREMRQAVFIRLGEAYDTLRNPESRARYERQYAPRAGFRPGPPPRAPEPPPAAVPPVSPPPPPAAPEAPAPPPVASATVPPAPPPEAWSAPAGPDSEVRNAEDLIRGERYWEAIQILEPLLPALSGRLLVRARVLLGQSYMKNPHWLKRAADQLQLAIEADPRNAGAYLALGTVYKASNLYQRAVAMFRKALELAPGNAEAQRELAEIEGPPPPKRKLFSRG